MMLDILADLTNVMEQFKEFILENKSNPLLWVGLFLIGVAVFGIVFESLQKEK